MESTLSALFASAAQGDAVASEKLFQALYAELHRLAKRDAVEVSSKADHALSVISLDQAWHCPSLQCRNICELGVLLPSLHHRQAAIGSGAHHQLSALPGDLFLDRERSVSELLPELA